MKRRVIRTQDLARSAASFIAEEARRALEDGGRFRMALSGGKTPRPVYAELARQELPWENFLLTFSDERCVPPDDPESNFGMAKETLLQPARVPDSAVLRMRGEIAPQLAADDYEEQLQRRASSFGEKMYQHDLILLGLGEDGHTASLFPGTAAIKEEGRGVAANYVAKLDAWRLTFTFPLIFAARGVCFLVAGNKHGELIERVLSGDGSLPAARVDAGSRRVTWLIGEV